jgi:hypothetical protein
MANALATENLAGPFPLIPALEDLPLHILQLVCEYLVVTNLHGKTSLTNFSLVGRRCYEAATRPRLERIQLVLWDNTSLPGYLNDWRNILQYGGGRRFGFVKQLRIYRPHSVGELPLPVGNEHTPWPPGRGEVTR